MNRSLPVSLERIPVIDDIRAAQVVALAEVDRADTLDAIVALEPQLLGKKGTLGVLKTRLGGLATVDEKKAAGQALNDASQAVEAALAARRGALDDAALAAQVAAERLDLTEFAGAPHAWARAPGDTGLGTPRGRVHRARIPGRRRAGGRDRLAQLRGPQHGGGAPRPRRVRHALPRRCAHDGHRDHQILLRTHTSPVQIRTMLDSEPPIYIVAPGRVFRRDTPDATHMPVFHQIEGLVVDRGITLADLAGTIEAFTKAFFGPGFSSRLRPSYFPFTEPSAEFDIQRPDGSWLELGGCGMVHPNVLRAGGIDPEEWSGFAFGFGIDRMAVMRHQVADLRDMYADDLRFAEQF